MKDLTVILITALLCFGCGTGGGGGGNTPPGSPPGGANNGVGGNAGGAGQQPGGPVGAPAVVENAPTARVQIINNLARALDPAISEIRYFGEIYTGRPYTKTVFGPIVRPRESTTVLDVPSDAQVLRAEYYRADGTLLGMFEQEADLFAGQTTQITDPAWKDASAIRFVGLVQFGDLAAGISVPLRVFAEMGGAYHDVSSEATYTFSQPNLVRREAPGIFSLLAPGTTRLRPSWAGRTAEELNLRILDGAGMQPGLLGGANTMLLAQAVPVLLTIPLEGTRYGVSLDPDCQEMFIGNPSIIRLSNSFHDYWAYGANLGQTTLSFRDRYTGQNGTVTCQVQPNGENNGTRIFFRMPEVVPVGSVFDLDATRSATSPPEHYYGYEYERFSSSSPDVARLSRNGQATLATALTAGVSTIKAEDPIAGDEDQLQLTVVASALNGLRLDPAPPATLAVGQTYSFRIIGQFADGVDRDLSTSLFVNSQSTSVRIDGGRRTLNGTPPSTIRAVSPSNGPVTFTVREFSRPGFRVNASFTITIVP